MAMDAARFPLSLKSRNLVRFCRHTAQEALDDSFAANFAWRDKGSRFSILKNSKSLPGPDECFATHHKDARCLFDKLLGMEIEYPELSSAKRMQCYNSMNYYRSHIDEVFHHTGVEPLPPIEGSCLMYCDAADSLELLYRLRNTGLAPVRVRLRFVSIPTPNATLKVSAGAAEFSVSAEQKVMQPYAVSALLNTDLAEAQFEFNQGRFESCWMERTIDAGGEFAVKFRMDGEFSAIPPLKQPPSASVAGMERACAAIEASYARRPRLRFPAFERLALKAAGTLLALRFSDRDPQGKRVLTIHSGKCGTADTWFWDSAFSILGLGLMGESEPVAGAMQLLAGGIGADGVPPDFYSGGAYSPGHQQPILAWGLCQFENLCPSAPLHQRYYPALKRYVQHWLNDCDSNRNGLVEYPRGGVCWDDALRWRERFPIAPARGEHWAAKTWGRMSPHLFENVDTNCHVFLEMLALAHFARQDGLAADAAEWEERAARLREQIHARLFNAEAGVYQDRSIVDDRFTGMTTPGSFMPLYAGIAPPAVAARICREYLLDPHHFYTLMPFPTLDRSHPSFRSGGFVHAPPEFPGALVHQSYWQGRTWPQLSYWMVGALYQSGLREEADAAALATLDAMDRSEALYECYDPLTGTGNGHPEFVFGAAAALALVCGQYTRGPLGSEHATDCQPKLAEATHA